MKNDAIWRIAFRQKKIEVIEMIETTLEMAQQPQVIDFAAARIEKVVGANEKPLPPTPKAFDVVSDISPEEEANPFDEEPEGDDTTSRRSSVSSMSPENDSRSPLDDLIREIMASQVTLIGPAGPGPGPEPVRATGEGTPFAESPTDPDFKTDDTLLRRPKHFQNREPKLLSFVPLARDSRGVRQYAPVPETIDTRTLSQTHSVDLSQLSGTSFPEITGTSAASQEEEEDGGEESGTLCSQKSNERVTSTTTSIAVSRIIGPPGDDLDDDVPPLPTSPDWMEAGVSPPLDENSMKRLSRTIDLSGMSGPPIGAPPFLQHPAFRGSGSDDPGPEADLEAAKSTDAPPATADASKPDNGVERKPADATLESRKLSDAGLTALPRPPKSSVTELEIQVSSSESKPQVKFKPVTVLKDDNVAKQEDFADGWSMLSPSAKLRMNLWNPFRRIPETIKAEYTKHSTREYTSETRNTKSSIEASLGLRSVQTSREKSSQVSRSTQSSKGQSSVSRSDQSSTQQSSVSHSVQSSTQQSSISRSVQSSTQPSSVSRSTQSSTDHSSVPQEQRTVVRSDQSATICSSVSQEEPTVLRSVQRAKEALALSRSTLASTEQSATPIPAHDFAQQSSVSQPAQSSQEQPSVSPIAEVPQDVPSTTVSSLPSKTTSEGTHGSSSPAKSVSPPRVSSPVSSAESKKKRIPTALGSLLARSSVVVSSEERAEKAKKAKKAKESASKHVPAHSWSAGIVGGEPQRQHMPEIYHEWPRSEHLTSSPLQQDPKSVATRMWEQFGVSPSPPAGWYAPGHGEPSRSAPQQPPPQYSPFHNQNGSPMNGGYQWGVLPMLPEGQGVWVAYWPHPNSAPPHAAHFQPRPYTRPMMEQAFKAEMQRHRDPPLGTPANGATPPTSNPNDWQGMYWPPANSSPLVSPVETIAEADATETGRGLGIGSPLENAARSPERRYDQQQRPWALAMPNSPFGSPEMQDQPFQHPPHSQNPRYPNFTAPMSPLSPDLNFPIGCLPPPSPSVYTVQPPGPPPQMLLPSPPETPQILSPYTQPQTAYPPHRAQKGRSTIQSILNPRAFSVPQPLQRTNTLYHGDAALRGASYPVHGWMPARWSE